MGPQKRTIFTEHENVTQRAATSLCRYELGTENGAKTRIDFESPGPGNLKIAEASGNSLHGANDPPRPLCPKSFLKEALLLYDTKP